MRNRSHAHQSPKGLYKRPDKGCTHADWNRCGCPWYVTYKGVKNRNLNRWWSEFAPEGSSSQITSQDLAERVYGKFKDAVDHGTHEKPPIQIGTFADLVTRFKDFKVGVTLREAQNGPRKGQMIEVLSGQTIEGKPGENDVSVIYMLDDLVEKFGRMKIKDLEQNPIAFRTFLAELRTKRKWGHGDPIRAERTWNRWFQVGRRLWNFALNEGIAQRNPFLKAGSFKQESEPSRRERRISAELQEKVEEVFRKKTLNTLDAYGHPHLSEEVEIRYYAAIKGGLRRGEMLLVQNERCQKIAGKGYRIELPPGNTKAGKKTKKTLYCYITHPGLIKLIDQRKFLGPKAFTFGTIKGEKVGEFSKSWASLFHLAGLNTKDASRRFDSDGYVWHDLRHEYISRLVDDGAQIHELMEMARITQQVAAIYMSAKKDRVWEVSNLTNR